MRFPNMNFHTHTTYCDGKETAEQMVQAAIAKGFTRLGFSGHGFNDFRPEDQEVWCMRPEDVPKYQTEVRALAEKYQDKIEILCGVEQDACSTAPTEGFDYVIGSVHYVEKNGMYYCVDESPEVLEQGIREGFGGDVYALTKRFFEIEAEVVSRTNATFIGHFDLVTKFNEGSRYFDPMDKRYRTAALSAMDALLETGRPFEINTGGMYRGLRTEPYPSLQLLRDLKERRGKILLSSDSHDGASLGFRFAEVAQAAKEIGFDSVLVLKKDGWEEFNYYRSLNYYKRGIKKCCLQRKICKQHFIFDEALTFSAVTAELCCHIGIFFGIFCRHICQSDVIYNLIQCHLHFLPDGKGNAVVGIGAVGMVNTVHRGQRAFQHTQYLADGGCFGRIGQRIAALCATEAFYQTGLGQWVDNLLQIFFGNTLILGDCL